MNFWNLVYRAAEYGIILPGIFLCIIPVADWLIIPQRKLYPVPVRRSQVELYQRHFESVEERGCENPWRCASPRPAAQAPGGSAAQAFRCR